MAEIHKRKMTVKIEGEFVVYLIGMRLNKPWKIHKWWPVFMAMPRMLKELASDPELGLMGYEFMGLLNIVQYWRSYEHLEAYARSRNHQHLPAWRNFNQKVGYSNGDVGIWHETYLVTPGSYEVIYGNMPSFGLGKAGTLVPAMGYRDSAHGRMAGNVAAQAASAD